MLGHTSVEVGDDFGVDVEEAVWESKEIRGAPFCGKYSTMIDDGCRCTCTAILAKPANARNNRPRALGTLAENRQHRQARIHIALTPSDHDFQYASLFNQSAPSPQLRIHLELRSIHDFSACPNSALTQLPAVANYGPQNTGGITPRSFTHNTLARLAFSYRGVLPDAFITILQPHLQ